MALLRSIITVSSFTFLSRIFGFVRDMLVAAYLGAGPIADACFVAFKMPNFFRRLFAEGAFNAAFVPLFSAKLIDEGKSSALLFAGSVMSIMTTFLVVFVIIFQIAMPWLMYGFAPGFADDPEKFGLAIDLTRVTFPYLLFISLVSLLGGILNSMGRFAAVAATPTPVATLAFVVFATSLTFSITGFVFSLTLSIDGLVFSLIFFTAGFALATAPVTAADPATFFVFTFTASFNLLVCFVVTLIAFLRLLFLSNFFANAFAAIPIAIFLSFYQWGISPPLRNYIMLVTQILLALH
mgnify:CR=1 FL=1